MIHTWKKYKLSEIGSVVGGATPSTTVDAYYNGDIPWLTPKDLSDFHERYIERGERNITKSGLNSCSAQLLPAGSVLFSSRAPIGYVAIAKNPIATNQGFKSIIPNPEKVDSLFLYYLLRYNKDNIEAMGSGTTFKEVSGATMKNIEVYLPEDLDEQRRIAGILGSLDDKIELNRRINANLEAQAQALFRSWFVDFEPFRDGPFVDSELGKIPQGWKVGTLSEVADITMGQSPKGSSYNEEGDGIIFYQGRAEFGNRFPSIRLYTTEPTRIAEINSVLLSVRAPVGDINIAKNKCCIGRGLAAIKSKQGYNSFILYLLQSLKPLLEQYNGEGTVFGCINRKEIEGLPIIIPKESVINEFERIAENIDSEIKSLTTEQETLSTLRDTLLPKLMAGEIAIE
ncbi:restriction endonuclease subunit S [uncultured Alistipes sp.]|uniref:restriction endonuclease subunit S n=1 Tax=uncultured Alistipes sp. TaxID=538949 RepID=UPI002803B412|nr:restriction endonuclease subunit S [uncultured Alistipes sp.]